MKTKGKKVGRGEVKDVSSAALKRRPFSECVPYGIPAETECWGFICRGCQPEGLTLKMAHIALNLIRPLPKKRGGK